MSRVWKIVLYVFIAELIVLVALGCWPGGYFWRESWSDPRRYPAILNKLESDNPEDRGFALSILFDPTDYPLPDVKSQLRLAIMALLGDEDENVRQIAGRRLLTAASRYKSAHGDEAYSRILVAVSRAMAQDPNPESRYLFASMLLNYMDQSSRLNPALYRKCKPYWERASKDADKDVANTAKELLLLAQAKLATPR